MIAVYGSTCGYPEYSPITISNSTILAPNQWRDSIRVGRTMSSCHPEEASEEAKILNKQGNIALVADTERGKSMGWCLTWTSSHTPILARGIVVDHANVAGGQGLPLHADDEAETREAAQALTMKGTDARFARWHVTLW